jgi:hypothetical protein
VGPQQLAGIPSNSSPALEFELPASPRRTLATVRLAEGCRGAARTQVLAERPERAERPSPWRRAPSGVVRSPPVSA